MPISNGNLIPSSLVPVTDLSDGEARISRILQSADNLVIDGSRSLTLFDAKTVYAKDRSQLTVYGDENTIVYALDNARVHAHGDGTVIATGSATVTAFDRVRVALHDTSSGVFHHRSRGTVRDTASAQFFDASSGTGHGAVKDIDVHDSASFAAYDMTMVNVHQPSSAGVKGRSSATITVIDDAIGIQRNALTIDAVDTVHVRVHSRHDVTAEGQPTPLPFLLRRTSFTQVSFYDTGEADPLSQATLDYTPGHETAEYQLRGSVAADWEPTPTPDTPTPTPDTPNTTPRHAQPDVTTPTATGTAPSTVGIVADAPTAAVIAAATPAGQSIFGPDWTTIPDGGTETITMPESIFGPEWRPIPAQ